ncbi:biotin carboxylase [Burkholderia sp. Bp9002]|nr:biotin carboxylase [Burkholderia sp. Bp9002]
MSVTPPLLLIVDYNLSRVADVAHLATYAAARHGAHTVLIRPKPTERDARLCQYVIDLDPLADDFVDEALGYLKPWRDRLRAGLVFSDNAVQSGAELLERLSLPVDSAALAGNAYSKRHYRTSEARIRDLLDAQRVWVPDCVDVRSVDDVRRFADAHPGGFVVKPSCEGNNRGVVVVKPGDSLDAAFAAVEPYLSRGAICESLIPFAREFSFDGVGPVEFITEKVSAPGRYPVEVAQILPARITAAERATLTRAGRLANVLVGQQRGPFHNEIKLDDDGQHAAVVEPNRRPAGMKIWTIAEQVYGLDFYALWVDAAFGAPSDLAVKPTGRQAATVMLGVPSDGTLTPPGAADGAALFDLTLSRAAALLGIESIRRIEFAWLADDVRFIPALPRDNADFAAQACFVLDDAALDMRAAVTAVRATWLSVLADAQHAFTAVAPLHAERSTLAAA